MRVTLLGAGVPTPTPRRFGSAYLLDVAGRSLLIDCGPATTYKLTRAGRGTPEISLLLFTHHHFDHNADYPCFVLTRWDQDVDQVPLRVYGPPPTRDLTRRLFAAPDGAWVCDWNARIEHPGSQRVFSNRGATLPRRPPQIDAVDIDAAFQLEEDGFSVRAADTVHAQPFLESVAYRIDSDRRSIVFTGDTEPVDSIVELARGADMLICMCWDTDTAMGTEGLSGGMTGTPSAATLAAQAGVRTLVLTHIGPNLDSPAVRDEALREAAAVFDGTIVFGEELQTLDVASSPWRGDYAAAVNEVDGAAFESEVLASPVPVVVDFWAPWCKPCEAIEPHLLALSREWGERARLMRLNVDTEPGIASRYGVLSLPTVILFAEGEPKATVYGAQSRSRFEREFAPFFSA